jgi:hypothetical protein
VRYKPVVVVGCTIRLTAKTPSKSGDGESSQSEGSKSIPTSAFCVPGLEEANQGHLHQHNTTQDQGPSSHRTGPPALDHEYRYGA